MIVILCALTSVFVIASLLLPFFFGPGGSLVPTSAISDEATLERLKNAILQQYLKGEELFKQKHLRSKEWDSKQSFLTHRYLDIARRMDWLRSQKEQGKGR